MDDCSELVSWLFSSSLVVCYCVLVEPSPVLKLAQLNLKYSWWWIMLRCLFRFLFAGSYVNSLDWSVPSTYVETDWGRAERTSSDFLVPFLSLSLSIPLPGSAPYLITFCKQLVPILAIFSQNTSLCLLMNGRGDGSTAILLNLIIICFRIRWWHVSHMEGLRLKSWASKRVIMYSAI